MNARMKTLKESCRKLEIMGIVSDILNFLKWFDQRGLKDVKADLEKVHQNFEHQQEDIKRLSDLCDKLMEKVSKLEGKYENAHTIIRQEIINGILNGEIKLQQKEIQQLLEEKLSAKPEGTT